MLPSVLSLKRNAERQRTGRVDNGEFPGAEGIECAEHTELS